MDFGFTNDAMLFDAANKFRGDAINDGWECVPTYGDMESAETHATIKKDGFVGHVKARTTTSGCKYKYEAEVSLWGPDRLAIRAPLVYDWEKIKAGVRTCWYCFAENVDTQRVGFAGRCCEKCLPKARKSDEYPGWNR